MSSKRAQLARVGQGILVAACLGMVLFMGYQMLLGGFSLAEFTKRTVLVSITAVVALALHRLLLYRLPPSVFLCVWLVVLVQMSGLPLSQMGLFARGLQNQLPAIQIKTEQPLVPEDTFMPPVGTLPDQPLPIAPQYQQEVTISYPSGTAQTLAYSDGLAQIIRWVWVAGTALCLVWFWGNYYYFAWRVQQNERCQCIAPPAGALQTVFEQASAKVQHHRSVRLCFSAQDGPLLLGVLSPKVVLPARFYQTLALQTPAPQETEEAYFILLHELTHAKHGDNIWSALAVVALATQWYNPLVWCCFFALKRDIERRCDAAVARITGDRKAYASVLLKTIQT